MGIISSAINSAQQAAGMRAQMRFQENAYKHRYQWQMKDLYAAGLNPLLAFDQAPPGPPAGAGMGPAQPFNVGDDFESVFSAKQAKKQLKKTDADIDLVNEQTKGQKIRNAIEGAKAPFKQLEGDLKQEIVDEIRNVINEGKNIWNSAKKAFRGEDGEPMPADQDNSSKKIHFKRFDTIKPNPMPKYYREAEYSRKYREFNENRERAKPRRRGRFTWSDRELRND